MDLERAPMGNKELLNSVSTEAVKILESLNRMLKSDLSGTVEHRMTAQQLLDFLDTRIDRGPVGLGGVMARFSTRLGVALVGETQKPGSLSDGKINEIIALIDRETAALSPGQ